MNWDLKEILRTWFRKANQLTSGIQIKFISIRGLVTEPPTNRGFGGSSLSNMIFFAPILMNIYFHTFQMISRKKNMSKKSCQQIVRHFLIANFFILFESFETHFDLVASKIGAKHKNLVIYDDVLVNFRRILSTESTILQKLKIGKLFFS